MPTPTLSTKAWSSFFIVLLALLLLSYLPLIGFLFSLVFSDAVLLGFSAICISIYTKVSNAWKLILTIVLWMVLSINFGIPQLLSGNSRSQNIVSSQVSGSPTQLASAKPTEVAIVGAANPIVTSHGYWWEVEPVIHAAGGRESMGRSLGNVVDGVALPDMLWERGITPRINGNNLPQLSIRNEVSSSSSKLTLEYFDASGKYIASYTRQLPLPPIYPGSMVVGPFALMGSVFYFNFWRNIFDINRPIHLQTEVNNFLDLIFGKDERDQLKIGPAKQMGIEREVIMSTSGEQYVGDFFDGINTAVKRAPEGRTVETVCDKRVKYLEFGGPGYSSFYWGQIDRLGHPVVLSRSSPDDAPFAFYCEPISKNLVFLNRLGTKQKPVLRISIVDQSGRLQSIQFFLLPRWLERGSVVVPNSWKTDSNGTVAFQMIEIIRWIENNHEKEESRRYRLINLQSNNSFHK